MMPEVLNTRTSRPYFFKTTHSSSKIHHILQIMTYMTLGNNQVKPRERERVSRDRDRQRERVDGGGGGVER